MGADNKLAAITSHLKMYQEWRKGNIEEMPEPKKVGETIDNAILFLEELSKANERIKELEELLTESRNHFLYATDAESGEPLADISTLINFWGKVNNALSPKIGKCKCDFPLVRNDGKEYCGNCNEDV